MPEQQKFWNPYRMLPVKDIKLTRVSPVTHERFKGFKGSIECTLENLTFLLIGRQEGGEASFVTKSVGRNQIVFIPGTSLKGMIRSLSEFVGNGCAVVGQADNQHMKCIDNKALCSTCSMFGMLSKGSVHTGKVMFSDGNLAGEVPLQLPSFDVLLARPQPEHDAFYPRSRNARKFYHHIPSGRQRPLALSGTSGRMTRKIRPLPPGVRFSFQVSFDNLEESELALLLYSLHLEQGIQDISVNGVGKVSGDMCHKLGMGKSVGLGSVKITINTIQFVRDPQERYSSLDGSGYENLEGDSLARFIEEKTEKYTGDKSPFMENLRKLMLWNPEDKREFSYPSNQWFDAHSQVKLRNP